MKNTHAFPKDALALLIEDHDLVKAKFEEFSQLSHTASARKKHLADAICQELIHHTAIEEEIFYPAVRQHVKNASVLVDEALVEHNSAKELIGDIQAMSAKDSLFDAKVKVLSEQILHHVEEEEQLLFPVVRDSGLDLVALRDQMIARKKHLTAHAA